MATTIKNPWLQVPTMAPFVLGCDLERVEDYNRGGPPGDRRLLVKRLMPEPYIGDLNAPVLLLSNNPGAGDGTRHRATSKFQEQIRANLHQSLVEYPFIYLADGLTTTNPNMRWWEKRVKCLLRHNGNKRLAAMVEKKCLKHLGHVPRQFTLSELSRSLLNVVYFPYASKKYPRFKGTLRSQEFGFNLVREAMNRQALIVFLRSPRKWHETIPELKAYPRRCEVSNFQNPTLNPGNLAADDFLSVVDAIARHVDRPA
jgi:hypothetical protein